MIIIMNTKWTKKNEKWVEDDFQKNEKKRQRRSKFKQNFNKVKFANKCFWKGAGHWAIDPYTLTLAGLTGLGQGFKYNGNLKRGLIASGITVGVMGAIGGVLTLAKNWKLIKK